jgi:putative DNA primase/helicase
MTQSIQDLVVRFGLKRAGRDWRGICPACGYGNGAFVVSTTRGGAVVGWCASCQDRDAIHHLIGGVSPPPADAARETANTARGADRALALWRGSSPMIGTPAAVYLARRGLPNLSNNHTLRFRLDTPYPQGGRLPAMLAGVSNPTGAMVAVHRTFLTLGGRKASVEPAKASLGPIWGGAIRLDVVDPARSLVIGEGVETAASAGLLMGLPAWAAITAGNLGKGLILPPEVRRVVIAVDPDNAGRIAATEAGERWTAEGREVRFAIPDGTGDFNDLLIATERTNG